MVIRTLFPELGSTAPRFPLLKSYFAFIFSLIPLVCAASVYGRWGGLAAGLLLVPLDMALFQFSGGPDEALPLCKNFWVSNLGAVCIGAIVGYLYDLNARYRKALEEITILRGILPICASCKKIRDDEGYWNQIESYIQAHSHATFSHGLCPDCAKKLYPDLAMESASESPPSKKADTSAKQEY
jgi:hypothetical protein